jgi:hypothetical protein
MSQHPADVERAHQIQQFGWAVMLITHQPPFGYTTGIFKTFGKPEIFFCGLSHEDTHALCNKYGEAVRSGSQFQSGDILDGWLMSGHFRLVEVEDQWKPIFMGKAVDDLDGAPFPALQAVWSTPEGRYPGDAQWPERLKGAQFVLNSIDLAAVTPRLEAGVTCSDSPIDRGIT